MNIAVQEVANYCLWLCRNLCLIKKKTRLYPLSSNLYVKIRKFDKSGKILNIVLLIKKIFYLFYTSSSYFTLLVKCFLHSRMRYKDNFWWYLCLFREIHYKFLLNKFRKGNAFILFIIKAYAHYYSRYENKRNGNYQKIAEFPENVRLSKICDNSKIRDNMVTIYHHISVTEEQNNNIITT